MTGASNDMRRLGEIHVERARCLGLRLTAFCTGAFPAEWVPRVVEDVTSDLLDFAFHARRVNNICGFNAIDFEAVARTAGVISENDPGDWKTRYPYALNALVHATSYAFGSGHLDHRRVFTGSAGNLAPIYVRLKTDHFEQRTISLFGITTCFLIQVIPLVKERFPLWRF